MSRGLVSGMKMQAVFFALSAAAFALLSAVWCSLFHVGRGSFLACSTNAKNCGSAMEHVSYHSALRGAERPSGRGSTPVLDIGGSPCLFHCCTSAQAVGSAGMKFIPGRGRSTPGLGSTGMLAIRVCSSLYMCSTARVGLDSVLPGARARYATSVSLTTSARPLIATGGA